MWPTSMDGHFSVYEQLRNQILMSQRLKPCTEKKSSYRVTFSPQTTNLNRWNCTMLVELQLNFVFFLPGKITEKTYLPQLDSCSFVFLSEDAHRSPLTPLYRGPYRMLQEITKIKLMSRNGLISLSLHPEEFETSLINILMFAEQLVAHIECLWYQFHMKIYFLMQ